MKVILVISFIGWSFLGKCQIAVIPMLGLNVCSNTESTIAGTDKNLGYRPLVGVGTRFKLSDRWQFAPRVLYEYKGVNFVVPNSMKYAGWNSYLSVPLIFNWTIATPGTGLLKVNAGLTPGFWISGRSVNRDIGGGFGNSVTRTDLVTDQPLGHYNRTELAIEMGIEYEFHAFGVHVWLTYKHAITPIYQPIPAPSNYTYIYNRWIQFGIGVPISINF